MSAHDLRDIARRLGGEVSGRNHVICPGPGHTKRDRSLSVRFDSGAPEGFLVNSFAGDDPIRCRDYVRRQLGLPAWQPGDERNRNVSSQRRKFDQTAMDREAEYRSRTEDDLFRIARANELWHSAKDPRRTAAEDYLRSRALKLDDDLVDTVLRFHPHCPWRNEDTGLTEIPALLAAFRSLDDDVITGVHRIRLDQPQYWPKAERRMLGIVRRAAVKLDAVGRDLIIGEGVETCMAARQLGHRPAWALGSVGAIGFFPIIDGVKRLLILGETGKASEEAIRLCGRRWHRARRRVLLPVKNNLGPPAAGLGFSLGQRLVGKGILASYVMWDNMPVTTTADEAIAAANHEGPSAMNDAKGFLREELGSQARSVQAIKKEATAAGLSWRTVLRAKTELDISSFKQGLKEGWFWQLPKDATKDATL